APVAAVKAFGDGVSNVLGFIAIVVGLGTMLGKMMAESGAATRIATTLIELFGERRVHWAIMIVAFIVGIPVFFQVGFVILILLASAADIALDAASPLRTALDFVGNAIVALLLALLFSFWSLARPRGFTRAQVMKFCNDCLAPTATILLVIGAGGGFNQV